MLSRGSSKTANSPAETASGIYFIETLVSLIKPRFLENLLARKPMIIKVIPSKRTRNNAAGQELFR
jgi:hypothetical protein